MSWRSLCFGDDFGFIFSIFFDEEISTLTGDVEKGERAERARGETRLCG